MNDFNELVRRYLAIWNEANAERRRQLIGQTLTGDASYLDPLMEGAGHAGIDAMIQAVQDRFAGHTFRQVGAVEAHHSHVRFSWELVGAGGATVVAGTDFGIVADDGRLQMVSGFIDQAPAAAPEE